MTRRHNINLNSGGASVTRSHPHTDSPRRGYERDKRKDHPPERAAGTADRPPDRTGRAHESKHAHRGQPAAHQTPNRARPSRQGTCCAGRPRRRVPPRASPVHAFPSNPALAALHAIPPLSPNHPSPPPLRGPASGPGVDPYAPRRGVPPCRGAPAAQHAELEELARAGAPE